MDSSVQPTAQARVRRRSDAGLGPFGSAPPSDDAIGQRKHRDHRTHRDEFGAKHGDANAHNDQPRAGANKSSRVPASLPGTRIDATDGGGEFRVVGIEGPLDLLEHTLLVFRERHGALPRPFHRAPAAVRGQ